MNIPNLLASSLAMAVLSQTCLAQQGPTFLSAPDGGPARALTVSSQGDIGIGTTSPKSKLEVAGAINLTGAELWTASRWGVRIKSPISSAWRMTTPDTRGKYLGFGMTESGWYFLSSNSEDASGSDESPVVIRNTGEVGIGIGSKPPEATLHIEGDNILLRRRDGRNAAFISAHPSYYGGNGTLVLSPTSGNGTVVIASAGDSYLSGGNLGIGTTTPQAKLDVNGQINCTVLELTSDRNQKQDLRAIDPGSILDRVLELPISTWAYTNNTQVRRIGPMAQDVYEAFGVGSGDKRIGVGDVGGITLGAIQGLNEKLINALQQRDQRIAELETRLAQFDHLAARLAKLEQSTVESREAVASAQSDTARALKTLPASPRTVQDSESSTLLID